MSYQELENLPAEWHWERLGNVCKIQGGFAFKSENYRTEGIPIIRISNIVDGYVTTSEETVYVSDKDVIGLDQFALYEGDLLIAMSGATTGKLGIVQNSILPAYLNQRVGRFLIDEGKIVRDFLYYFLIQPGYLWTIFNNAFGAAIPNVSPGFLASLMIPLPPLAEQKRIVAILNQQMAAVEQARQVAQAQLEAAQALPSAYLRQVFDSPQASKWPQKTLDDVCGHITDGTHHTPTYVSSGVPFLSVKDIRETGISFDNCQYISQEEHERLIQRCQPEQGDVLYTKVGTTGIAKSIDIERDFSIFVSVALLKLKPEIKPEYLQEVLNSPLGRKQAEDLTQGMANRNLVIKDIRKIRIPVPSIYQQEQIVAMITKQKLITQRLIQTSQDQLNTIEKLPATLLRRAFNGEL